MTGAASGIGRAIAERLVEDGHSVLSVDLEPDTEGPGIPYPGNLATVEGNRGSVGAALDEFGGLDLLVRALAFSASSLSPTSPRIVGTISSVSRSPAHSCWRCTRDPRSWKVRFRGRPRPIG